MSGTNYGKRYGPEGRWLGSTYVLVDRIRFGESEIVMALRTTLGAEVVSRRGTADVFLEVYCDGKPEDSYLGETM